ncbi:MAG: PSD1 and planctomycete cytochrome C domain-containing protein [Opitutaceae bacterium]
MSVTSRHLVALLGTLPLSLSAQVVYDDAEVLFVHRVQPLLQEKCVSCHGQDEEFEGGLDLRTEGEMIFGGDSNQPAVDPGQLNTSPLYLAVLRDHEDWEPMPPKEAEQLDTEETAWLADWINGGAPWPEQTRQTAIAAAYAEQWDAEDGTMVTTSGGLADSWTYRRYDPKGIWAYQPVSHPDVPTVGSAHPIDAFIDARIPAGLALAPAVAPRTFIRRATFDLLGLPPTPEEVAAFQSDSIQNPNSAIPNLIDRLLASPHYGERMAQHWLDVTRYADSSGFANDYERGNTWRYRDYVVRAFNDDKPYDEFIREQIAGDEIDPDNPEFIVATGFLRMGPWELTAMEVPKIARQRFLDDVTNSVGETFLAQSLQCARCHDHKFDPIPTRDYYAIQSVFATTQLSERSAPFLPEENTDGFQEKSILDLRRNEYITTLNYYDELLLANAEQWFVDEKRDPTRWHEALAEVRAAGPGKNSRGFNQVFDNIRRILLKAETPEDEFPPKAVSFTPQDYGNERMAKKGYGRLNWEIERYEPFALAVYGGRTPSLTNISNPLRMPDNRMTKGELEDTQILPYGDPFGGTESVPPGVLSALGIDPPEPLTTDIEGRRRAFAEWVARPDNALTTRAIVNRVWLWHFGQPIAGNPNNFGSTGKPPTHPELLDWLATELVEGDWSIKALHRTIMTSDAYRRSTRHPDRAQLAALDPVGESYAAFLPRRLTAEELRDAMLRATGELNPQIGGIPNRPDINLEAALQPRQVMGAFAPAWVPNPLPTDRHRRSLYATKLRGLPDPAMEVFNQPAPDFSCEQRDASVVTPQVFNLFNSSASHGRALALANRAVQENSATDSDAIIERVFELALNRALSTDELTTCVGHWDDIATMIAHDTPEKWSPPLQVTREAVEENTGESFTFEEVLHAYADYVPDLQPADVPLRTRALADVCLALYNAAEFSYVY